MGIFSHLWPSTARWGLLLLALSQPAWAQTPGPDSCAQALSLTPGAPALFLSNAAATLNPDRLPAGLPATCIESFENDLWFRFETQPGLGYYAVTIAPQGCNTPAGLQALLIQAPGCDPASFDYVDCQNPQAETPLRLFVTDTLPGRPYLVYVDGYDGTECAFTIRLEAAATDPRQLADWRGQEMDFGLPDPAQAVEIPLEADFRNNEVSLRWEAAARTPVAFFQVLLYPGPDTGPGWVLATVDPVQAVGDDPRVAYSYLHQATFAPGQVLCYRVAWYDPQGRKAFSPPICLTAEPVEDFYVSPVRPGPEKGIFEVHYINKRKQDLRFQVLDAAGKVQKEVTLSRVGLRDGKMEIDMRDFAPGPYDVRVEGKAGFFQRRFRVE